MRRRLAVVLGILLLALGTGCSSIWGFADLTLGHGDGGFVAAPDAGSDAACVADDPVDCAGKCGELQGRCGTISCGGCSSGTCGGGGPNVCGSAVCMPDCAGKACGASDGCAGVCGPGNCVACDPTSCPTGCCSMGVCTPGDETSACGTGGLACSVCSGSQTCSGGSCAGGNVTSASVILFGGQGVATGSYYGDTWAFSGSSWTQVMASGPSARGAACMATLGNQVVLFGGYGGAYQNDTWTFDGSSWSQVSTAAPPARSFAAMATIGNRLVLFGGYDGNYRNDTWLFDGVKWTEVTVSNPPTARQDPNMATLDSGQVVLFGGTEKGATALDDTWLFDGSSWTQTVNVAGAPTGRSLASMASLGVNSDLVVLFGGDDGNNMALADTWLYGTGWSQPVIAGSSPPGRTLAGMGTLTLTSNPYNEVVLFGGDDIQGSLLGDTWTFDGTLWTQVGSSGPPPRDGPSMALLP